MNVAAQPSLNEKNSGMLKMIHDKAYINGQWVGAEAGQVFSVINPANGDVIGDVPDMRGADTEKAIQAAEAALPAWRALLAKERAAYLKTWHQLILDAADDLAVLLTAEQGKPLAEAKGEVLGGATFVEWYAEEAKRAYGDVIPTHKVDARVMVTRQPVGVVGAITPWNFPNAMITRKVAPALAAGCTVVLKPAEDTPLSALALMELAEKAGIPAGVLNIVTCDIGNAPEVGKALTDSDVVRKISFTGSTQVGKLLAAQSADTVKKVSLELGGNAPFIVFASADLDKALEGAIGSKFRNAGQTCICANRLYVHEDVYEEFSTRFAEKVSAMKVAPGDEKGAIVGPLINKKAIAKVDEHVKDAVAKGAKVLTGGAADEAGELFYKPTVLANMTVDMRIKSEETFGPVAGLFKFSDEADLIRQANDTNYGLAAYFYSQDVGQCFRVAEALEYGMVGVNEPMLSAESVPFGGVKESGVGREGSKYGLDEFCELKYILLGGL